MFFLDGMMSQVGAAYWLDINMDKKYYIFPKEILQTIDYSHMQFQSFFTFYLLLNIMIPLDLTITMVFAKMMYVTIL